MNQQAQSTALHLFGPCFVPAVRETRPAPAILPPEKIDEGANSGLSVPFTLSPDPVVLWHSADSEEILNRQTAGRTSAPLHPKTPVACLIVDPADLHPPKMRELVRYRFERLDPIYNPPPDAKTKALCMAALKELNEASDLRNLVLKHFLPQESNYSGETLAQLFLHRVTARRFNDYLKEAAFTFPTEDPGPKPPPERSNRQKATEYWDAYREKRNPALPPYKKALSILQHDLVTNPHPGEEGEVASKVLLKRLEPIHGEEQAFQVIDDFLANNGHRLNSGAPTPPTHQTEADAAPGSPHSAADEEPPGASSAAPDKHRNTEAIAGIPEGGEASPTDPLLEQVLEITAGETGDLARSRGCWARILDQARACMLDQQQSFADGLDTSLNHPTKASNDPPKSLRNFLRQLGEKIDLPC